MKEGGNETKSVVTNDIHRSPYDTDTNDSKDRSRTGHRSRGRRRNNALFSFPTLQFKIFHTLRMPTIILYFSLIFLSLPDVIKSLSSTDASKIMSTSSSLLRSVKQILPVAPRHWVGDGFHVHPVFSNKAFSEELSPFLMFDYAPPQHFPPNDGSPRGVGQHPHRGKSSFRLSDLFRYVHST